MIVPTLVIGIALLAVAIVTDERWNWSGRLSCWWHGRHIPTRIGYTTYCCSCHKRLAPGAQR